MNGLSLLERLCHEVYGVTSGHLPIEQEPARAFLKALLYAQTKQKAEELMRLNRVGTLSLLAACRLTAGDRGEHPEPLSDEQFERATRERAPFVPYYDEFADALDHLRKA
jgi:hypothetical protein